MNLFAGIKGTQYSALPDNESKSPSRSWNIFTGPLRLQKGTAIAFLILLTSIVSGIAGYLAGNHSTLGEGERLIQLNKVPRTFEYEFHYADAPSNLTNERWDSLFPLNGGFFKHPKVGRDPVAFAVFHQLHCLDGIRHAYWRVRNGNHMEEEHSHHAEHSSDTHVLHCIEYIRQSLMCSADTTIELAITTAEGDQGVKGFGTEHICKDFRQLVDWTSKWEKKPKTI